ncbi:4'-phosphopantetheinyl transferase [Quillaja saponaria]|uniref:holo-[acyl-carrier-protein] synthase n=1 Tax=Quillaja saponaria TaxID=32244 RepID=A0AAD7Q780_QUISA|nr:4'-phosphopantetheinyl transferase [Quillaja saponaria]
MFSLWYKASSIMNIHCFRRNVFTASSPLPPVELPSQMETHIWYLLPEEVKSTNLLNRYLELLSPCEKENVFRMTGDQLKKRALLARALVRTTIARYQINQKVDPRSLKFMKNNYGKPEVYWQYADDWSPPPLHFNISHTSSLIACGVTVGSPIGIDVEEKQRRLKNNILTFARRYFSPYEVETLTSISDPEIQHQEFLKLWTLKEAYVKALGKGFSAAPFKTFTIQLSDPINQGIHLPWRLDSELPEIIIESPDGAKKLSSNWHFALLELAGSHIAAICMKQEKTTGGNESNLMKLTVQRTIPLIEDECVSGTDAAIVIGGLTEAANK